MWCKATRVQKFFVSFFARLKISAVRHGEEQGVFLYYTEHGILTSRTHIINSSNVPRKILEGHFICEPT